MIQNCAISGVLVVAALIMPAAVPAAGMDLHWLWHDRCAACHGHAGAFARESLRVSDGELQGRHHVHDLRRFLHHHYLAGHEVDAVYDMLLAQALNPTRFMDECSHCHGSAAEFVRDRLVFRGGGLYSRTDGRPLRGALTRHRHVQANDIDFFTKLLTRVAHEVYRPQSGTQDPGR